MKRLFASLLVIGFVAAVGCNKTDVGGRDTAKTGRGSAVGLGRGSDNFTLTLPTGTTSTKQGEKKEVTISIDRGTEFKEDVKVKLTSPTPKLKFSSPEGTIKASEKEMKVLVEAADDAPLGEHKITVTGTPEHGAEAHGDFTVKVTEKSK